MSYKSYVEGHKDLLAHYNKNVKSSGASMAAWGAKHWAKHGKGEIAAGTRKGVTPGGGGGGGGAPSPGGNPNAVTPNYTPGTLYGSNVLPSANPANPTKAQYAKYVDNNTGKYSTWALIEARLAGKDVSGMTGHQSMSPEATADYWIKRMGGGKSKSDFGKAHYTESKALHAGTYRGGTKVPYGTGVRSFGLGGTPGAPAPGPGTKAGAPSPSSSGGGNYPNLNAIQEMDLATLTDPMMLSNAVSELINTNSPLFRAAETQALQLMAKRGIVNSSLAREGVMSAIMQVAIPIAQADVQTLQNNLYYNTDWSNKQKSDYNTYVYNTLRTKLEGAINYTLRRGDWMTALAGTNMSAEQTNYAINSLPNYPFTDMLDAYKSTSS